MALHTALPIYRATNALFAKVVDITRSLPRDFKASVGGRVRDESLALVVLVYRANCAHDKVPHLTELLERLQVTELLLRLLMDLRFISTAQYAQAGALTDSIGKQANGWRRKS